MVRQRVGDLLPSLADSRPERRADGRMFPGPDHAGQTPVRDLTDERVADRLRLLGEPGGRRANDQASPRELDERTRGRRGRLPPSRARRARTAPRSPRRPAARRGSAARPSPPGADHRLDRHRHVGLDHLERVGEHRMYSIANNGSPPMLRSTRARSVSFLIAVVSSVSTRERSLVAQRRQPDRRAVRAAAAPRRHRYRTVPAAPSTGRPAARRHRRRWQTARRAAPARTSGGPRSSARAAGPRRRPRARAPPPRPPPPRALVPRRRSHPPAPTNGCAATHVPTRQTRRAPPGRPARRQPPRGLPEMDPGELANDLGHRGEGVRIAVRSACALQPADLVAQRLPELEDESTLPVVGLGHDRDQRRAPLSRARARCLPQHQLALAADQRRCRGRRRGLALADHVPERDRFRLSLCREDCAPSCRSDPGRRST